MEFLGKLASGQIVVDRPYSHIRQNVRELLPEVFRKIHFNGEFDVIQVDFDRVVGETTCVVTSEGDEIVYAVRTSSKLRMPTRFVKNRVPESCKSVTVILKRAQEGYVLITAFIGLKPEPEPWDLNATERSVEFWNSHALIWGTEEIIPGTESTISPW